ncbi:MAG: TylF/MycF/NovP-related O-methyltransferase [Nitrospira sp.]|nr:hypothetical protein [Candidatus Manganitrophaceae bacterium]HIL35533.1 hypothetical protein [Candidatus Manganitrophaceae bacterium]
MKLKKGVKKLLIQTGLYGLDKRVKKALRIPKYQMSFPPYGTDTHKAILGLIDVVRFGSIALAIHRLQVDQIGGELAEAGVYKGELSKFITSLDTGRTLHLFDTFSGFPQQALDASEESDDRFTDTSVEAVKREIGDCTNIIFHEGIFPDTAEPILNKTFAFVMLDMDKYKPTLAGLEIFYPRMSPGGYIFIHDYNSPESEYGVSRAVNAFFKDKVEQIIELPDRGGSAVIRKA